MNTEQATAFYKDNNVWKEGKVYYKNEGMWVKALKIYIKQNGVWVANKES